MYLTACSSAYAIKYVKRAHAHKNKHVDVWVQIEEFHCCVRCNDGKYRQAQNIKKILASWENIIEAPSILGLLVRNIFCVGGSFNMLAVIARSVQIAGKN